ncbi:Gfo/Idh/MocA family oxidoreductase [Streptomyces sp. SID8352]|uniref:Gfo/Idh/MocA family protein n=1 Tax=Streptomyces sp. SID8352 TaxID=2690338 RepID=UPI00136E468C|nr:Gfo/Idh/MocA family oxidoreductase [Streptomyces sp. SID8352]MYU23644.1 Gfo/Idh/MocA family oxidoreductase [Streptomyces sp. SID8352]
MAEPRPLRYALSGAGKRAWKTYLPLFGPDAYAPGIGTLVAVADIDPEQRAAVTARWQVPTFGGDIRSMLAATRPDMLIVTAPDHAHAEQIQAALSAGVEVLTEKPMTLSAAQAESVVAAERGSPASVRVAHNMRYLNLHQTVKRLLDERTIGQPVQLHLAYRLRPGHGRSYFLRWHRRTESSGGLQITKSCHHFDLLNWWLADRPQEVAGWTRRVHYRPDADTADRQVPADADIADVLSAVIRYRGGVTAHYSLSARSSWEGYTLTVLGTEGELTTRYEVEPADGARRAEDYTVEVSPLSGPPRSYTVSRETGRHSGADAHMIDALLRHSAAQPEDHTATAVDGAYAVAVGEALTRSAAGGAVVAVDGLLPGICAHPAHAEPAWATTRKES